MTTNRVKPPPYVRAYGQIMHHPHLTPSERLVLTVICRFWPNQCWMANSTIAYETGLSKRHVQKCIAQMKSQLEVYKRGIWHKRPPLIIVIWDNDPYEKANYTRRWIVPTCLPGKHILPLQLQTAVKKRLAKLHL